MIAFWQSDNCDLEPVTNQVTTAPGYGRQSAKHPDAAVPPTCGNPTQPDAIGRNRHACNG